MFSLTSIFYLFEIADRSREHVLPVKQEKQIAWIPETQCQGPAARGPHPGPAARQVLAGEGGGQGVHLNRFYGYCSNKLDRFETTETN